LQAGFTLKTLLCALLYFILIFTFYEIGYIENDTETVKKEKDPTLRLSAASLEYYEKHKTVIYLSHILTGCILAAGICFAHGFGNSLIALFLAGLLLLLFYFYNRIRNTANLYMQIFLVSIKYSACQFLFF
jgi:hypothetical protein